MFFDTLKLDTSIQVQTKIATSEARQSMYVRGTRKKDEGGEIEGSKREMHECTRFATFDRRIANRRQAQDER